MNKKKTDTATISFRFDALKWTLAVILVIAGLWANYHYAEIDWPLRLGGWIILACVGLGIISQTAAGNRMWEFSKGARAELRKVVWPTRKETIQTTVLVIAMVILMALLLWGIDSFLLWIVGLLTGQ